MECLTATDKFTLWVEIESVNVLVSDCVDLVSRLPSHNEHSECVLRSRVSAAHREDKTRNAPFDAITNLAFDDEMELIARTPEFDATRICFACRVVHPVGQEPLRMRLESSWQASFLSFG